MKHAKDSHGKFIKEGHRVMVTGIITRVSDTPGAFDTEVRLDRPGSDNRAVSLALHSSQVTLHPDEESDDAPEIVKPSVVQDSITGHTMTRKLPLTAAPAQKPYIDRNQAANVLAHSQQKLAESLLAKTPAEAGKIQ